jgi:ABC-type polysaccharide/polyol phosphate export permease
MACGLALMWIFYVFPFSRTVILTLLMRLIAVVSGTFFVYTDLPYTMRPIANWFPPLHINDKIRESYFYTFKASWASPDFVFLSIVIIFGFGLFSCEATRRQLKVR